MDTLIQNRDKQRSNAKRKDGHAYKPLGQYSDDYRRTEGTYLLLLGADAVCAISQHARRPHVYIAGHGIHVYTITDERVTCRLRFRDTVSRRTDTTAHRRDALSAGNRDTGIR